MELKVLNLPKADLQLKRSKERLKVRCLVRNRFIVLTPEEWVRQHFISFLIHHKGISAALIGVEMSINYNGMDRRCDIVVFSGYGKPEMIIECKAPDVLITEKTFYQIAQYNFSLRVDQLVMTNGMDHFIAKLDAPSQTIRFVKDMEWRC